MNKLSKEQKIEIERLERSLQHEKQCWRALKAELTKVKTRYFELKNEIAEKAWGVAIGSTVRYKPTGRLYKVSAVTAQLNQPSKDRPFVTGQEILLGGKVSGEKKILGEHWELVKNG